MYNDFHSFGFLSSVWIFKMVTRSPKLYNMFDYHRYCPTYILTQDSKADNCFEMRGLADKC